MMQTGALKFKPMEANPLVYMGIRGSCALMQYFIAMGPKLRTFEMITPT